VPSKFNFTEGAFTDGLAEDVLSDFALIGRQFDIRGLLVGFDADLVRVADRLVNGRRWCRLRLALS